MVEARGLSYYFDLILLVAVVRKSREKIWPRQWDLASWLAALRHPIDADFGSFDGLESANFYWTNESKRYKRK
jgi:hypothetical protein